MTDSTRGAPTERPRLAVLISGGGRTLRNLLEHVKSGALVAEVSRVISTRRRAGGNQIAENAGVPVTVVPRRSFSSVEDFSATVIDTLDKDLPDLVVCAGFLSKLIVPDTYMGRIVNIHPSLLPLFGGMGFYGDRVHQAVLDSGMRVSGCSVHFVDNEYDAGPIIAQRCVPVEPDDTVETLAARVFEAECDLYPRTVEDILEGRIWLDGDRVRVVSASAGSPGGS